MRGLVYSEAAGERDAAASYQVYNGLAAGSTGFYTPAAEHRERGDGLSVRDGVQ